MNLLAWILFGVITGIVANAVDTNQNEGGLFGSLLLGILGAMVGGFFANLLFGFGVRGFNLTSFVIAVAGSLLLLFVGRAVRQI